MLIMTYAERMNQKISKLEKKWGFWGMVEFFSGLITFIAVIAGFAIKIFEFGFTQTQENSMTLAIVLVGFVGGVIFLFSHWASEKYQLLVESLEKRRR